MRPRRTTDQLTRLLTRSSESQTVQAHSETRGRLGYSGPLHKVRKAPIRVMKVFWSAAVALSLWDLLVDPLFAVTVMVTCSADNTSMGDEC